MGNWQHTLKLKDLWDRHKDFDSDEWITVEEMGKEIVSRIQSSNFYGKYPDQSDLDFAIERFNALDEFSEDRHFNAAMSFLYDWCDRDRRVWIETFF